MNLERIGLDTSKAVFTRHGVDHAETAVLRRSMRRAEMEAFFAKLPPAHTALEACGGSHHWGRKLGSFGPGVRLIPPRYVKPFPRGHAAEFGIVAAKGASRLPALPEGTATETVVPDAAKEMLALEMLAFLGAQAAQLDALAETRSVCGWDCGTGTPNEAAQSQPGPLAAGRGARHRPGRHAEPGAHD